MESDWLKGQKIIVLEPRRLAARSLAQFLASQLGELVGQRIGYQVRNDRKRSNKTQVEILTEGILIRRLQQDPELRDTALIIFDEFHERSLEGDLALTLSLECQSALREDLKILLMSATLESGVLSEFLDNAPVIQCPGRTFPVTKHYLPTALSKQVYDALYQGITLTLKQIYQEVSQSETNDCLVFLPGQKEIFRAIQHASNLFNHQQFALLPLHGGLSPDQQDRALQKDAQGRTKIIFTTNIAETSLTIEGIQHVIDSGLVRKANYDASSGMTRMVTQNTSKASATQRAGRAGRLSAGHAHRLWTESEQRQKTDFEAEAMLTSDLSDLILEVAMWGENSPYHLRWLTPPPKAHYEVSKTLLTQLGFLTTKGYATPQGEQAVKLGLSCRLAKMLLSAGKDEQQTACDLAAILSDRDIFKKTHTVNIEDRLQALQAYRTNAKQALQSFPLIVSAVKEAMTNSQQWIKKLQTLNSQSKKLSPPLSTGQLLALAYPDRIAKCRSNQDGRYQLSNGKGTFLHESDALTQQKWLVITSLDGQRREGRTFMACPISLSEIQSLFKEQIRKQRTVCFDAQKQKIQGEIKHLLGAITLQSSFIKQLTPAEVQHCLIETLKASHLSQLPWKPKTRDWLNRVQWLAHYMPEFEGFSEQALLNDFDLWCAPYLTHIKQWSDLAKLDLLSLLKSRLTYQQLTTLEQEAPTTYIAPSQKKVSIEYQIENQPRIAIQLQELFGELRSPSLAQGQVNLTFELLSPARRTIQITNDLAHFWQTSYIEVAKEMRGKYPKHRWPEKPLEEKAGRSIKRRK
jgi:ATP-dependent helicase HrpB